MNKPWWLWEGAAVRCISVTHKYIATVEELWENGMIQVRSFEMGCESKEYPQDYLPIENPAVMLAPEEATHAAISPGGEVFYTIGLNKRFLHGMFIWKECPDNLKGMTWPLPKEANK